MRKRCRLLGSGLFGALLLLPLVALLTLQIVQAHIQSTREERLTTEALHQVVIAAKDLVWEEEDKELMVDGRMFDVASFEVVDGFYRLTGVYDDDETEVLGSLLHTLLSNNGEGLLRWLLLLQCATVVAFSFLLPFVLFAAVAYQLQPKFRLLCLYHPVRVPPPRPS